MQKFLRKLTQKVANVIIRTKEKTEINLVVHDVPNLSDSQFADNTTHNAEPLETAKREDDRVVESQEIKVVTPYYVDSNDSPLDNNEISHTEFMISTEGNHTENLRESEIAKDNNMRTQECTSSSIGKVAANKKDNNHSCASRIPLLQEKTISRKDS